MCGEAGEDNAGELAVKAPRDEDVFVIAGLLALSYPIVVPVIPELLRPRLSPKGAEAVVCMTVV